MGLVGWILGPVGGLGCPLAHPRWVAVGTPADHGLRASRVQVDHRTVRLGKAYLVSRLQMLLQSSRVHLPRTAEAEALATELLDYQIRVD